MTTKAIHYHCYRQFLLDYIESKNLSYRSFAAKHCQYISFPFLSKLLRRNSSGKFTREVNIKPEKLAALLKAMDIEQACVSHLILCRLENDKQTGPYKHASAFSETLRTFKNGGEVNSFYLKIFEGLENLLVARRKKVIDELKSQLLIEIERASLPLRAQELKNILKGL